MKRRSVFEAIKTARGGKSYTTEEVLLVNTLLEQLGIPEDGLSNNRKMRKPSEFFVALRRVTGPLNQTQINTINGLLDSAAHWPISWLAYGLATAWHEARFMPIPEYGRGHGKPYAKIGKHGHSQYGRGLVQLTWDENYEWADRALARAGMIMAGDLLRKFDLALDPKIASFILIKGMEEGAFCKDSKGRHDLKRHLPNEVGTLDQFITARRIINGTDRANAIAIIAQQFMRACAEGEWK